MKTQVKVDGNFRFCSASIEQKLFSVVPGVGAADALQIASNLLDMVDSALIDVGMGEPMSANKAFLLQHAVESAKAAVDAVQFVLESDEEQEAQP